MTALDILYLTLSFGVVALVVVLGFVGYHLVQTLKILQQVMSDVEGVTADISKLRYLTRWGVSGLASRFFQLFAGKGVRL